jgi:hypothetical protein
VDFVIFLFIADMNTTYSILSLKLQGGTFRLKRAARHSDPTACFLIQAVICETARQQKQEAFTPRESGPS